MKRNKELYLTCQDYTVSNQKFDLVYNEKLEMLETFPQPKIEDLPSYYESSAYISHTDSKKSFIERLGDIYLKIQPKDVDLLVYTPDEFNRMSKDNFFIRHAIKEGKVIYERTK